MSLQQSVTGVVCVLLTSLCLTQQQSVNVWLSTGDSVKKLNPEPAIPPAGSAGQGRLITVDTNTRYQTMKGFGAAISNSAAYLLHNRPEIMEELFGSSGIGISYIRLVMGGSDFNAVQPYTYNDIPSGQTDFLLEQFSIAKDNDFVIPVVKEALRLNPDLKIMASPWSAPAWMKSSGSLNGGFLIDDDLHMDVYARYFVRFLQAYKQEGINIDTLTVQNEPEHQSSGYPTMHMWWQQQSTFIRQFLGPALITAGLTDTAILTFDHNWDMDWYPINLLSDSQTAQYVAGSAWHCYGGDKNSPANVKQRFPEKDIYFTECSGGAWDEHFGSTLGWNMQNLFIGQSRVWARTVLLWNMALDASHGPRVGVPGGCTNCRGVVTVHSSSFDRNVEYYSIGHFSKFVKPGAVRIESSMHEDNNLESIAFQNTDSSIVVVITNTAWGDNDRSFSVRVGSSYYNYSALPSRSTVTFVLSSTKDSRTCSAGQRNLFSCPNQ